MNRREQDEVVALMPSLLQALVGTARTRPPDAIEDALGVASVATEEWYSEHDKAISLLTEDQSEALDKFAFKAAEILIEFIPPEEAPKTFYVLWTYVANHSEILEVEAATAHDAAEEVRNRYGSDFREHAKIYVFDLPPAHRD